MYRTPNGLFLPESGGRVAQFAKGARWLPYIAGGQATGEGYNDSRDLVLADNITFREIVAEIDAVLAEVNQRRDEVLARFCFETTEPAVTVRQAGTGVLPERGSEYGTPGFQRTARTKYTTGLPMANYKWGAGWTIEYLAFARSDDLRRDTEEFVAADNRLLYQLAMQTLFNNLAGTTYTYSDPTFGDLVVRAPLLNGDGMIAAPFEGHTFAGNHEHYFVSGGTTLTQANLIQLDTALEEHGHRTNKIVFVNEAQVQDVLDMPDFIQPADPNVVDPAAVYSRVGAPYLGVLRGYNLRVRKWNLIPAGYVVAINDYGPGSQLNPVARREWPANNPLRGLKLYRPNPDTVYPVEQLFYQRWVGFGSNNRTNGAVMQITAGAYTVPSILQLKEG